MNNFSAKTVALTALIAWGAMMSSPAHAAILRRTNGVTVLTKDGNCVITNWEGSEGCAAAKAAAGIGSETCMKGELERTVYFDFNKSTLTPEAKRRLDHLAWKLRGGMMEGKKEGKAGKHHRHQHHQPVAVEQNITVVGYADRLGNAAYNEKLALKRAEAVRAYLVAKGVKAKKIEVRSLGKTEPRAECPADMPRAKLIRCLREDRRVEIEIGEPN
jgi:outer membrane protein OmpA-like peptidoglycan-associated protein